MDTDWSSEMSMKTIPENTSADGVEAERTRFLLTSEADQRQLLQAGIHTLLVVIYFAGFVSITFSLNVICACVNILVAPRRCSWIFQKGYTLDEWHCYAWRTLFRHIWWSCFETKKLAFYSISKKFYSCKHLMFSDLILSTYITNLTFAVFQCSACVLWVISAIQIFTDGDVMMITAWA